MSDVAIRVENISKRYRIGVAETKQETLMGTAVSWLKSPFYNFRRLRSLSNFGENGDGEDVIWALKDISFEVKQGEVLGIIGRNGAGKSTLLKVLSRITPPTAGTIELNGRVASLLEVGTGFHPELTGRENVYLNGTILGMTKAEIDRKFDEIVDFSGVEKFIDTPVKRYSSGMNVRLAFSVAAHLEPEVLLIDEVLAVGDVEFQRKSLGRMREVSTDGRTVLFVSHDLGAVQQICSAALVLDEGKTYFIGDTRSAIRAYQDMGLISNMYSTDLSLSRNRRGEGGILVQSLLLLNDVYEPVTLFESGKSAIIAITYKALHSIRKVDFAISIRTLSGSPLFLCNSRHHCDFLTIDEGMGIVYCEIKNMPLADGKYSINVAIQDGMRMYDWIGDAMVFEVISTNYYGNGAKVLKGHSPFLVKSNWSHRPQAKQGEVL